MSSRTHCIFYGRKITKNKNVKLNIENGVFYIGKNLVFCLSPWRRIFLMQEFARHVQEKMPVYLRFAIMGNHFDLMKIIHFSLLKLFLLGPDEAA
jgi:hypothetical protein